MRFETASERLDGAHLVSVAGEVDIATGDAFERALRAVPADGGAPLVVDLNECGFMDSTGAHVLIRARERLGRSGGRLVIVAANRSVLRLLELTGIDRLFPVYPTRTAVLNGDGDG